MSHRIKAAFSLIEVVLAIALFAIFGSVLITATLGARFNIENAEDRLVARYLTQETQEALRSIRDYDWDNLSEGTHGLSTTSNYWELSGSSDSFGKFTRSATLTKLASYRYEADITIAWTTDEGVAQSMVSTLRLTNWKSLFFIFDDLADFEQGFFNSVETVAEGSVQLMDVGDWGTASVLLTENLDRNGNVNEIYIENNLLLVATNNNSGGGNEEFFLYDIADVSSGSIRQMASVEIGTHVNDFVIYEGYAILATSGLELMVVRLSDFTLVNTLNLPNGANAWGIAMNGSDAIIVRENNGAEELYVVDMSSPESPLSVSASVEFGSTLYDVEVASGYAFVVGADDSTEMEVLRLSDNSIVNSVDLNGAANALSIRVDEDEDIAYMTRLSSGQPEFYAYDVASAEATISPVGVTEIGVSVSEAYVHEGYAYLASDGPTTEVNIVDLSTYTLEHTINASSGGNGRSIWYQGAHIYLGTTQNANELQVISSGQGGWTAPVLVDSDNPSGSRNMYDIAVSGNYAYMVRDAGGTCNSLNGNNCEFLIYDISTPTSVSMVGALELAQDANDIYVNGNYAYIASDNNAQELMVVDISNPAAPFIAGGYNSNSGANGEAVWGDGTYVYLGTLTNSGTCNSSTGVNCEIYILDVGSTGTPTAPVYVGGVEIATNILELSYSTSYLFVGTATNGSELRVVDVSSPSSPSVVATYNHPGNANLIGMYYDSTTAYLHTVYTSNGSNGEYSILDVSTPTSPTRIGFLDLSGACNMVAVDSTNNLAFLGSDVNNQEFVAVDLSNIATPTSLGVLDLNADANGVAFDGSYVYMASEHNTQEFQVVGQTSVTTTVSDFGIFTTQALDSVSTSTTWGAIEWTSSGPGTLRFQTRTADTQANLDGATWVGSDGTRATYYTTSGDDIEISVDSSGERFLQVAAYFEGDGSINVVLEELTLSYSN